MSDSDDTVGQIVRRIKVIDRILSPPNRAALEAERYRLQAMLDADPWRDQPRTSPIQELSKAEVDDWMDRKESA